MHAHRVREAPGPGEVTGREATRKVCGVLVEIPRDKAGHRPRRSCVVKVRSVCGRPRRLAIPGQIGRVGASSAHRPQTWWSRHNSPRSGKAGHLTDEGRQRERNRETGRWEIDEHPSCGQTASWPSVGTSDPAHVASVAIDDPDRLRRCVYHLSGSLKSCMGLLTGQCWPRPWSRARIAASVRVATLSLAKMVEVLLLTVLSESPRLDAMAELE